jgi:hypothetical protein
MGVTENKKVILSGTIDTIDTIGTINTIGTIDTIDIKQILNYHKSYNTYIYKLKDIIIKEYLFFCNNILYSLECHYTETHGVLPFKIYMNNSIIYDIEYIESYKVYIILSYDILNEHNEFIKYINEHFFKTLTFNHKTKYGWRDKNANIIITINKYNFINETYCVIKQFDNENTQSFKVNRLYDYLKELYDNYKKEQNRINQIKINQNILSELLDCKLNISDKPTVSTINENDIIKEFDKLSIDKLSIDKLSINNIPVQREIFINQSKKQIMEYYTCKTYDEDEISFNNHVNQFNL